MWPSLPAANHIADVANIFFIGSLVVGVVSTVLIVWMSGVKEAYWEKDRTESAERVASLVVQGDILRKDTAEANARASEAQLALERLKAPRSISGEQQAQLTALLKPFAGQEYSGMVAGSVPDARALWVMIDKVLTAANWVRMPPWGAAVGEPPAGIPIAPSDGVTIFVPAADVAELAPAAKTLASALAAFGIVTVAAADSGPQTRPKIMVVEIGTKPQ
jgi:hypothetical protein